MFNYVLKKNTLYALFILFYKTKQVKLNSVKNYKTSQVKLNII